MLFSIIERQNFLTATESGFVKKRVMLLYKKSRVALHFLPLLNLSHFDRGKVVESEFFVNRFQSARLNDSSINAR